MKEIEFKEADPKKLLAFYESLAVNSRRTMEMLISAKDDLAQRVGQDTVGRMIADAQSNLKVVESAIAAAQDALSDDGKSMVTSDPRFYKSLE